MSIDRKKVLVRLTLAITFVGIALISIPFIGSLNPNAKGEAALPRINISHITPGQHEVIPHPALGESYGGYEWAVLIYRKLSGEIMVWDLQVKSGRVGMPDLQWWRPFYACSDFGPTSVNGVVDESKPIQCHDAEVPEWWDNEWRWDISGKNLGNNVSDLLPTKGTVEGKYFVYAKRS